MNAREDALALVRYAQERGLRPYEVALVSIDTRSSAWTRLRAKLPDLSLKLAAPPMPVVILMLDRTEAASIMKMAGSSARYSDPRYTLETKNRIPLIFVDDGMS